MRETWLSPGYDLLPTLREPAIPTLMLHGDRDIIPVATAAHVADAIPGAQWVVLARCGLFAAMERPATTLRAIGSFIDEP